MVIRFIEMYGGVGGVRRGFEKANRREISLKAKSRIGNKERLCKSLPKRSGERRKFRCVWANDWEYADFKWKKNKKTGKLEWKGTKNQSGKIYRKHWDDGTYVDADVKTIDAGSIPDFDLLTAGFPCPSWSVAGKRKGFKDDRGQLFWEIIRIAKAKKPSVMLLENVKGLLSHNKSESFEVIVESLCEIGYVVDFKVLNSKFFGVPQNRERVFIVAIRKDLLPANKLIYGERIWRKDVQNVADLRNYLSLENYPSLPMDCVTDAKNAEELSEENGEEKILYKNVSE